MSILLLVLSVLLYAVSPVLSVLLLFASSLYYEGKAEALETQVKRYEYEKRYGKQNTDSVEN